MKDDICYPENVAEAVDCLLADLSLNDEIEITTMKKEDLPNLHFSLGVYIRNKFDLWSGNEALMRSCRSFSGNSNLNSDDASLIIIRALWERLMDRDEMGLRDF